MRDSTPPPPHPPLWHPVHSLSKQTAPKVSLPVLITIQNRVKGSYVIFATFSSYPLSSKNNCPGACLRADVSYFLCCTRNKGNRRRLHAGNPGARFSKVPVTFSGPKSNIQITSFSLSFIYIYAAT